MRESHYKVNCIILGYEIFAYMYEFKSVSYFFRMLGVSVTEYFASFRMANCSWAPQTGDLRCSVKP
jgi:hypothetical protein